MKQWLCMLFLAIVLVSCGAHTPYDTFRKQHKEKMAFSADLSGFLAHLLVRDADFKELKSTLKGVRKYRISVGEKASAEALNRSFDRLMDKSAYESMLYVNSQGSVVELYLYSRGTTIKEVLMRVAGANEFVVLSAQGSMALEDLEKLLSQSTASL